MRTVKAGMRAGQSILIAVILVDVELGDAVHAFKVGKPVEWCFACSGHKLQELGTFLARESGDGTEKEISINRIKWVQWRVLTAKTIESVDCSVCSCGTLCWPSSRQHRYRASRK